jgi:hypothetical protein
MRTFGRVPDLVATDRGFYSGRGVRKIQELGVKRPVIPKPGRLSNPRTRARTTTVVSKRTRLALRSSTSSATTGSE